MKGVPPTHTSGEQRGADGPQGLGLCQESPFGLRVAGPLPPWYLVPAAPEEESAVLRNLGVEAGQREPRETSGPLPDSHPILKQ